MAKSKEPYLIINVESYKPSNTSGLHGQVHIRPVKGQAYPETLRVECSKELSNTQKYPIGTVFQIRAKLTDRNGSGEFLYSSYKWPFEVVKQSH